ncbi:PREDICTED: uncharacterized protein LOC107346667 [Acropora digitifera]|uniref:uncharacterized protein LOC107346667 n=1 Tax=Acropora digitifera TaxID=70779 RepID=UPI00077A614E|nr:PREDICTED: uncharacterized protein LOC107346667 [Acropora digitifera]
MDLGKKMHPQTETVKRFHARPQWQQILAVSTFLGFTLAVWYNLWNSGSPVPLDGTVSSSIVHEQRGEGLYLTLKLRCFYCDSEDFGASWENLIQNRVCQDSVFQTCFINQTLPGKQATQVIDLVRSCRNNCACSDEGGWCSTLECRNYLKCCWERAYCDED